MKTSRYIMQQLLMAALATMLLSGCSLIDDVLGERNSNYELDYELCLVTNMTTEIKTQLSTDLEVGLAHALKEHLSGIFSDYAHDIDLSFYDTEGAMPRLQHYQHIMDAPRQRYTLYLPMPQYMHLAVANVEDNPVVGLNGDGFCPQSSLSTVIGSSAADTIASHTTGLFTARQPMTLFEGVGQPFHVPLYMANCAAALVIDPRGHDISSLKVFSTGFASQFNICDSTYVFAAHDPIVRTQQVRAEDSHEVCYCSVMFPSREPSTVNMTRSVVETTEPFMGEDSDGPVWKFITYITRADGSVTQTVIGIRKSIRAGQLMIFKGYVTDDGAVQTDDHTVGVSVTLDWNNGGSHDVPL
jgi:hypothetical protein